MKKSLFVFTILLIIRSVCLSQTIYGTNQYVEYGVGTLPIIISVPHGGSLTPEDIPDRTCNDAVTVTDANTIDLGRRMSAALEQKTGCKPHMIYCHLRRTKLDANRSQSEGTCDHPVAIQAWKEFHKMIDTARYLTEKSFQNKGFYYDIHGHGHEIQRLELGYLLSGSNLQLPDQTLNQDEFIQKSSIQNLVKSNTMNLTHAQLLRGPHAFGTLLANKNYPSVPSEQDRHPGDGNPYFSGGYSTATHTCFSPNIQINGVQIECNFQNVRNSASNRSAFADAFAESVIEFMKLHFNIDLTKCSTILSNNEENGNHILVYPSIISPHQTINMLNVEDNTDYMWLDQFGKIIKDGKIQDQRMYAPFGILPGIYFIKIANEKLNFTQRMIIVE